MNIIRRTLDLILTLSLFILIILFGIFSYFFIDESWILTGLKTETDGQTLAPHAVDKKPWEIRHAPSVNKREASSLRKSQKKEYIIIVSI